MAVDRPAEGNWRGLRFAAGLMLALFASPVVNAATADSLTGGYNGAGIAIGMAMVLNEGDEQVYGRMIDGEGNVYRLSGQLDGGVVEGRLYSQQAAAAFKLEPSPTGLQFVLIPTTADGKPNQAAAKEYSFARGEVTNKTLTDFRVTPPKKGESADILAFLENYRGWKDKDVANAYVSISDHDRAFINKFDHLQADLMDRLCRGRAPTASIMAVAENEDLDCAGLTALIDQNERMGSLNSFNEAADSQRSTLYGVFACGRNLYPASRCAEFSATAKRAAQSWKGIGKIFTDLYKVGALSGAVQDDMVTRTDAPSAGAQAVAAPALAPAAPPTEQAKKPAAVAKLKPPPMPRDRPIFFGHANPPNGAPASVDELVLANADQSSKVASPRKLSLKEGFGFELRPGVGQANKQAQAAVPSKRGTLEPGARPAVASNADALDVHPSNLSDVPTPRRRPLSGG